MKYLYKTQVKRKKKSFNLSKKENEISFARLVLTEAKVTHGNHYFLSQALTDSMIV